MDSKTYFPQLTGLRAIAAYMVYFFHTLATTNIPATGIPDYIFQTGYLGVSVFFVLSGFLICYRYFDKVEISRKWFQTYMVNRIARIYPLYFILTLSAFIYNHYSGIVRIDPLVLLANLTFLKGFFNDFLFTGITQGWSLTVEETFYLLAPLLFLFIHKKFGLVLQFLFFASLGAFLVYTFRHVNFYGFMSDLKFMINYTFFGRCFEFLLGIKLALLIRKRPVQEMAPGKSVQTYLGLAALIAVLAIMSLSKEYVFLTDATAHEVIMVISNNFLFPLATFCLLKGLIIERSFLAQLLGTPAFQLLGKASYAFYLVHVGFIAYFINGRYNTGVIVQFIIMNGIAIALYYFIEHPLNRFVRRVALPGEDQKLTGSRIHVDKEQ